MIADRLSKLSAAVVVCALALSLGACGSSSGSDQGGAAARAKVAGTGSLDGQGKQIAIFLPSSSNVYIAREEKGLKAAAEQFNYSLKIFENNFDQTAEDQQVQQFIASGVKPALILWWPSNDEAALNSLRLLSRVAPVIQFNQRLLKAQEPYVQAYAGVNDLALGVAAGKEALLARDQAKKDGVALHSASGNLIEFRFPTGYQAGDDRQMGFATATDAAPFKTLRVEPMTAGLDAQDGYTHASQILPQYKSAGVDFIYAHNLDSANGIVKALEENGYQPGRDVQLVAGNCAGNTANLRSGKIFSAGFQAPVMEGELTLRVAVQFLAAGKVSPGAETVEATPAPPKLTTDPPKAATYLPTTPMTAEALKSLKVWGLTGDDLCTG